MIIKVKKLLYIIFGTQENLTFKISTASFITAIIFTTLLITENKNDSTAYLFFTYATGVSFAIWLITARGADSAAKIALELLRLMLFFTIVVQSLNFCLNIGSYNGLRKIIYSVLTYIGIFMCAFYFTCKLSDIFDFIKKLFVLIKIKVFNSSMPPSSKFQTFIENVTVFLVSIGGLAIAIGTIVDVIFKIMNH